MKRFIIHTDGGARGNPGPAGIGVLIEDEEGNTVLEHSRYLGEATNNQAEYQGVILGLDEALKLKAEEVDFYLDSELAVNQLNRNYKVKNLELQNLFIKIWNLSQKFKKVSFRHIPREQNRAADRLVNKELDNQK